MTENYINNFKTLVIELSFLGKHKLPEYDYKRYFIKNIENLQFEATKHNLYQVLDSDFLSRHY